MYIVYNYQGRETKLAVFLMFMHWQVTSPLASPCASKISNVMSSPILLLLGNITDKAKKWYRKVFYGELANKCINTNEGK